MRHQLQALKIGWCVGAVVSAGESALRVFVNHRRPYRFTIAWVLPSGSLNQAIRTPPIT